MLIDKSSNWRYELRFDSVTSKQIACIISYLGSDTDVSFPKYINDIPVTEICDCVFTKNADVEIIRIPDGVPINVDGHTLATNCPNLSTVYIGSDVKKVNSALVEVCPNLKNIIVSKDNPFFTDEDGILFDRRKTILILYPSGKENFSYTIPNTVTTLDAFAFAEAKYLQTLKIPPSVNEIGAWTFNNMESITKISFRGKTDINIKQFSAESELFDGVNTSALTVSCPENSQIKAICDRLGISVGHQSSLRNALHKDVYEDIDER